MVETLSHLISQYGYLAVAIGCFFEGETSVLLGMLAAHRGILTYGGVWTAATLGTMLGDNFWFHVGRITGRPALTRRPGWQAKATRVEVLLEKYGPLVMIGFRFLYAMRSITPFVLGALGTSPWRFLFYDLIGTLIWSTTITIIAYFLADAIQRALGHIQNVEQALLVLVLVVIAIVSGLYYLRRRRRK
ncbi:MAG: DedA family protein [Salinisphaera sp.]|jgi:membrane protein DedA with SNARE-associated domain|nr:DedA family protein [Salinisphaera sp.]